MLGGTYSATLPATCVVPAVMDETQSPAVQERPAITYYTAKGASPGLPAESDDGTSRWTAQVVLAEAEAAEAATTSPAAMGGIARTQAGVVAWHTGNVVQKTWLHNRRVREEAWYKAVNTSRSNALTVATAMADTDSFATTGTLSTV